MPVTDEGALYIESTAVVEICLKLVLVSLTNDTIASAVIPAGGDEDHIIPGKRWGRTVLVMGEKPSAPSARYRAYCVPIVPSPSGSVN